MSQTGRISRRTALRGLGTAISLPFLESMSAAPALAGTSSAMSVAEGPRRVAFFFVPNGVHLPNWTPATEGYGFSLPFILEPLAEVRDDLMVLSGLTHDKGRGNGDGAGDHARSASVFLTGAQPRKTSGANIRSGISVDQVAAKKIAHQTRIASLELGCEAGRNAGNCDSGYSCAYSSNISWASSTTPVAKETNPKLVFDRLFSQGTTGQIARQRAERKIYRRSLLDFVLDDARSLQKTLGTPDQRKLDEYLSSVREIERRTEAASPAADMGDAIEAPEGIPEEYGEHLRLMCDMMVLAFQADLTRVSTCMFANAGSNRSYRQIDVPDGHHNLSHHGGDPEKLDKISRINRFHMQHFAYFLQRLKAIPEGNGTLLDHCMIVYGSGLSDGNRHNNENLPILLAGHGGGTLATGRHVRYPEETPLCNLYMSLLDRMDASVDWIGDSTGRLHRLDG